MIQCPKCKAEIDADSFFCDQCGEELMMCPKCKEPRKGKRCSQCGSVLVAAKDLDKQPPQQPQQPQQTSKPSSSSPSSSNQKSTSKDEPKNGDGMSIDEIFTQFGDIFGGNGFGAFKPQGNPADFEKKEVDTVFGRAEVYQRKPQAGATLRNSSQGAGSTIRGANHEPKIADTEPSRFVMIDNPSKVVVFKPGGIIGRTGGDYVDVFGSCGYVSGTHGKLTLHSSMRWLYTDLGSTNGTELEGKELEPNKNYLLKKGQIIEIGYVKFRVE